MTLKELIGSDVADLFFDLDEFAETHVIEGKEVDVVLDRDRFVLFAERGERSLGPLDILFFARSEDLSHVPRKVTGSVLNIDGREFLIDKWVENMGVSEVQAHQNRSI